MTGALLMAEKPEDLDELMNPTQVAEFLHVSRPIIYKLMEAGLLKPVTPHNPLLKKQHRKFRRADVERLARGETSDTGASGN